MTGFASGQGRASVETGRGRSVGSETPFFIVGAARSGTTLFSLMLDGHPRLAVPPESHFIVDLAPPHHLAWLFRPTSIEDVLPHLRGWKVDKDAVRRRVSRVAPRSYPELMSAVFSSYAADHGKPRWGNKTAREGAVAVLGRHFPEARFVHLIRDGRDVAASLAERSWGPRNVITAAHGWRRNVRKARRAGRRLEPERYMELRLEDLVADPEKELRNVCDFLGELYAPEMLDYVHRERAVRSARRSPGMRHLTKPPTAGLRDWRSGLSDLQHRGVEAVCHDTLLELGYSSRPTSLKGRVYAWAVVAGQMPLLLPAGTLGLLLRYLPRVRGIGSFLPKLRRALT